MIDMIDVQSIKNWLNKKDIPNWAAVVIVVLWILV
jgi:hypothetical protein|tara:strand:+ start:1747 stop:1851 length:105 start_codon:yes stop_codon:yes gene_type:complete